MKGIERNPLKIGLVQINNSFSGQNYFPLSAGMLQAYAQKKLKPEIRRRLSEVKPIMSASEGVALSQENWLELLASYHYLRKVSGQSHETAKSTIEDRKIHVSRYVEQAKSCLEEANLFN